MKKTTWNTYYISAYTHDVANDQRSAGGCHYYQVRKTRNGFWQERICQANGRFESYGPVHAISEEEGEANFATAEDL